MATHLWDIRAPLPVGISVSCSAQDPEGEWLYIFAAPRIVRRYNMRTNVHEALATPDVDFSGGASELRAVWVDRKIYVFNTNGSVGRRLMMYDPFTNSWSYGLNESGVSYACYVAADPPLIYVAGGAATRLMRYYDTSNPASPWTTGLAQLPALTRDGRHRGAAAFANGKFWVMAGIDAAINPAFFTITGRTDYYDLAANAWTQGPTLPAIRDAMAITMPDGSIFIGPGDDNNGASSVTKSQVYRIRTAGLTAAKVTGPPGGTWDTDYPEQPTLPQPLSSGYAVGVLAQHGAFFMIGGNPWFAGTNDVTQRFFAQAPIVGEEGWGIGR